MARKNKLHPSGGNTRVVHNLNAWSTNKRLMRKRGSLGDAIAQAWIAKNGITPVMNGTSSHGRK